jgi:hypothetical protein
MQNLRTCLLVMVVAVVPMLVLADGGTAGAARSSMHLVPDSGLIRDIRHYRTTTVRMHLLMGRPATFRRARHISLQRTRSIWRQRAVEARQRFLAGPMHRNAWMCIHRYEGSWRDDGGPYYGGLQMDIGFQSRYGGILLRTKGTANNWSPLEQMWVAEHAYRTGRGFYPWPNTARFCGLI